MFSVCSQAAEKDQEADWSSEMLSEDVKILWDAPAVLNLMQVPTGKAVEFLRGGKAAEGTLAECIKWYMKLPEEAKFGANIVFVEDVVPGQNGMLQPGEIEEVFARSEFPRSKAGAE